MSKQFFYFLYSSGKKGKCLNKMSNNATQLIHSIPVDPLTGAIAVPIAGQLHEIPLVAVVLFRERLGSFRVRVNDAEDEIVVL